MCHDPDVAGGGGTETTTAGQPLTRIAEIHARLERVRGLRTAMETRGVIEQAKGILMVTLSVDADVAFQTLVRMSQTSHTKLVEVARGVVQAGLDGHVAEALQ
jgi:AmiR/NasT family two-component response regulator